MWSRTTHLLPLELLALLASSSLPSLQCSWAAGVPRDRPQLQAEQTDSQPAIPVEGGGCQRSRRGAMGTACHLHHTAVPPRRPPG